MKQSIRHISLLIKNYDEAITFYTQKLDFTLLEDTPLTAEKRWVLVAPPGESRCSLIPLFLLFLIAISACGQDYNKVKQELTNIYKEDQETRTKFMEAINDPVRSPKRIDSIAKVMESKDSINRIHVSRILDTYGWLGSGKIGEDANQTLFLVVQHADLQFQLRYLPMFREAVQRGNGLKKNLAMLEDRVALRQHKLQIYGSQIGQLIDSKEYYVFPLLDPESVDLRRAEVGLPPYASYLKQFNIIWDPQEYIKQLPKIKEQSGYPQ